MAHCPKGVARPRAVLGVLLAALTGCSCATLVHNDCCDDPCCPPARVCQSPTVRALAADLDDLEQHIDKYGSVVAKVPDVWGQARLTKFRQQFENEIVKTYDNFELQLQGSLARSDQAFFANSFALGLAVQPRGGRGASASAAAVAAAPAANQNANQDASKDASKDAGKDAGKDASKDSNVTTPNPTPIDTTGFDSALLRPDGTKDVVKAATVATVATPTGSMLFASSGVSLEPTEYLAQKARYLNYLDQIRRTNEGDDTADSPGYSLNLVRMPVSLLPGKCTDQGYGAEVTCTLTPVLGEDLLPTTFRNLVVNDIVKHVGYPLAIILNDDDLLAALNSPCTGPDTAYDCILRDRLAQVTPPQSHGYGAAPAGPPPAPRRDNSLIQGTIATRTLPIPRTGRRSAGAGPVRPFAAPPLPPAPMMVPAVPPTGIAPAAGQCVIAAPLAAPSGCDDAVELLKTPLPFIQAFAGATARLAGPATKSKRARVPFPASQMQSVYSDDYVFRIAHSAYKAFRADIAEKGYAHLPDIRAYLQEEVAAAYKFLSSCDNQALWNFCTPALACAVRTHDYVTVEGARCEYFKAVANRPSPLEAKSLSAALGWAILVESALLTEQLVQDMREAATAKGVPNPPPAGLPYFLPCPPPEARKAFNDYVALRWPIHVFALDPAVEEQNIADSLVTRREMQLALSIAFATGEMNANNFMKFARRLDAQYETIALNRTQVGFSHGEDTFGWRFYPRFQSPDTESNLTVFVRDQLIGGPSRDALLKQRRLEPGPRECVAIVLMPSFVPYLNCDVTGNWFKLSNPKHKQLDTKETMRLSRSVKAIQSCGGTIADADCYRGGDLARLLRKAEQLSNRLPLQTLTVQVPYENTLGGFEMFNTGVTDLAPELYGWYGAPGIECNSTGEGHTTLFLVGDHFSVNQTKVIAGNRAIGGTAEGTPTLLSRQVAMVKVPNNVLPRGDNMVEVQLATPYGVTQTIAIPAVWKGTVAAAKPEGYSISPEKLTAYYTLLPAGKDAFGICFKGLKGTAAVNWHDNLGNVPPAVDVTFVFTWKGATITIPCPPLRLADVNGTFPIPIDAMNGVIRQLVAYLNTFGPFTDATNPLATVWTTAKITITPIRETVPPAAAPAIPAHLAHAVQTKESLNPLTIEFVSAPICLPALPPPAAFTPLATPLNNSPQQSPEPPKTSEQKQGETPPMSNDPKPMDLATPPPTTPPPVTPPPVTPPPTTPLPKSGTTR